jgi:hypothetical protein
MTLEYKAIAGQRCLEVFQAGKGFVQHPHLSRELLRIRHRLVSVESQRSPPPLAEEGLA